MIPTLSDFHKLEHKHQVFLSKQELPGQGFSLKGK